MFSKALPVDREARWALLGKLLDHWFRASPNPAGVPVTDLVLAEKRLGRSLPPALCEFYARYGARKDIWGPQDSLYTPEQLRIERDVLILCVENQGVVEWGIRVQDLALEDPPVVVSDSQGDKAWLVESATTSGFAIQFALMSVKWAAPHSANGQGTDEAFAAIERRYARLPFELHWPVFGRRASSGTKRFSSRPTPTRGSGRAPSRAVRWRSSTHSFATRA